MIFAVTHLSTNRADRCLTWILDCQLLFSCCYFYLLIYCSYFEALLQIRVRQFWDFLVQNETFNWVRFLWDIGVCVYETAWLFEVFFVWPPGDICELCVYQTTRLFEVFFGWTLMKLRWGLKFLWVLYEAMRNCWGFFVRHWWDFYEVFVSFIRDNETFLRFSLVGHWWDFCEVCEIFVSFIRGNETFSRFFFPNTRKVDE